VVTGRLSLLFGLLTSGTLRLRLMRPTRTVKSISWLVVIALDCKAVLVTNIFAVGLTFRVHMKRSATLILLAFVSLAHAEPFDVRVQLGKAAEQKDEFKAYQPAMFAQVGDYLAYTMRSCFETIQKPETEPFVLVADINTDGKAVAVEIKPTTNIANCFSVGFSAAQYPKPPQHPDRKGFPITLEMRITP